MADTAKQSTMPTPAILLPVALIAPEPGLKTLELTLCDGADEVRLLLALPLLLREEPDGDEAADADELRALLAAELDDDAELLAEDALELAGTELAAAPFARAPIPQGIGSPSSWLALAGGVVACQ